MSTIHVYDFDGVLCDPIEDTVFRLEENDLDKLFIELGRDRYGITRLSNHVQRNRHLILQEVLYERGICPGIGPCFEALKASDDPFYVLTARSGPGAVARVSQFFETVDKRPEEMFFVGPMSKDHCLIDICNKFYESQIVFSDDNMHHIEAANALGLGNLEVRFVDNQVDNLKERALMFYQLQVEWLSQAEENNYSVFYHPL